MKRAKTGGSAKIAAFLKRNVYYILMVFCVLAIASMITVAAVLNNKGKETDVIVPPDTNTNVPQPEKPVIKEFILTMPVDGEVILNYGGNYTDGKNNVNPTHNAIDIKADAGVNVISPFEGTVTKIDTSNKEYYGAIITIDHGNGYVSVISLVENVSVEVNQKISSGTVIGKVASTDSAVFEQALGSHVHYELLKNGAATDPNEFLAGGNK